MLQAFRGPGLHFLPENWGRAGHMIELLDESKRPGNSGEVIAQPPRVGSAVPPYPPHRGLCFGLHPTPKCMAVGSLDRSKHRLLCWRM